MPEPRSDFPFIGLLSLATSIFWLSLPGCDQTEKIQKYSVPNHNAIQTKEFLASEEARHPTPVPRRMIGVIIPKQTSFWFFKLEGEVVAVASREAEVRDFVKTVHFPDPKKPDEIEWQAPEKWNRLPPTPLRYATLVLDGAPKLEISVTTLPVQPDQELNDQILANINRWRGQLSLDPIKLSELDLEAEKIALSDSTAYWVSLAGWALPKTNMMPPGHPPAAGPADSQPRRETPRADDRAPGSQLKYEKPAEWQEAPATVFSKVSLQVSDGDKKVAVTVTPSRGTTVDNVNRWRNQLKLESQSPDELMASAKKVSVGNLPGNLFEMKNGDRSIYGVIVEQGDMLWFVKLDGNTALAERERPRFETFVKSLQLN